MDRVAGWGLVTRLLHWGMAALILVQLALGLGMMTLVADVTLQFRLVQLHKSLGFVVFVLALVRICWRLVNVQPAGPPMPAWQARAAKAAHLSLYGLMLALPISGWLLASASPLEDLLQMRTMVFGLFPLPDPIVPGSEAIEQVAGRVHAGLAIALGFVLVLHVAAAAKHQLVDRDGLITRMVRG